MKLGPWVWLTVAVLALPLTAYAQDTTLMGTVRDNTGGVLPGVTVTATNAAQGTTFVGVTDERGLYRIVVRAGTYEITSELSGFATAVRPGVEILLGRQVNLNFDMQVSGVQEKVTVTGEAPLLDVTSSNIGGNIDPRQMQDIPINGRNWMDLTLLAPGARQNASSEVPQDRQGFFQVNVDGQSVTLTVCCSQNQPRYSRDSIAEFVISTNRFDATQGRTMGMMVNAITKSGTNTLAGTFAGYFRNDKWNAADFIQKRVVPYEDQQISGTLGGPIVRDRIHFFANWEYEREPSTITFSSVYPTFNVDLPSNRKESKGGAKVDWQLNSANRASARWSHYQNLIPQENSGGATNHPSTARQNNRYVDQYFVDWTRVIGNNSTNALKGGLASNYYTLEPNAGWGTTGNRRPPATPQIFVGVFDGREIEGGTPRIEFSGYAIGTATNTPQRTGEHNYQIRDDFTTAFQLFGRHDLKMGADFIKYSMSQGWCNVCNGRFTSNSRPPANIEQLLPVWNDASTWNYAALSPLMRDYQIGVGNMAWTLHREIYAAWYQDDWRLSNKLTANMGVRYDLDHGAQGEWVRFDPWLSGKRPTDKNNFAPRIGFAYQASENTVVRGGWGLFFTELEDDALHQSYLFTQQVQLTIPNNGRPDFASNPFGGPKPTYEQVIANACDVNHNAPGCYKRSIPNGSEIPFGDHDTSYSHMGSVGVQRQVGATMAFESNFVWTGGRKEERRQNVNLMYNPATGANYPFTDVSHNPFPEWGPVYAELMTGRSNYRGLESQFTKRFSDRWQANASYTVSWFYDDGGIAAPGGPFNVILHPGDPIATELVPLGFNVAPDLRPMYQLTATDQRHRATFNGIWEMGRGFQVSGLYFFGSGERRATNWGADLRNVGGGGFAILQPDGTLAPRAALVGKPIHRVDMRVQKRLSLGGRRSIDGMVEVFNVFNHANYGAYTTSFSNPLYGQPSFNGNVAYQPRILQLGFRVGF
jgi:carboxypeptidase family protein/TonB-dependent receptor-like protein